MFGIIFSKYLRLRVRLTVFELFEYPVISFLSKPMISRSVSTSRFEYHVILSSFKPRKRPFQCIDTFEYHVIPPSRHLQVSQEWQQLLWVFLFCSRALCYTLSYKSVFIAKGAVLHVVSLRHRP